MGERFATLPPSDRSRSLRSERGTPRFCAHALPSDPCRTGGKKGHGRQAGQAAGRQTKDTFAKSRLWPVRRGYLIRELRSLWGKGRNKKKPAPRDSELRLPLQLPVINTSSSLLLLELCLPLQLPLVIKFSADMSVILGTHVHVQEPKMLTSCICTSSAIKHVDPHTGSLASPLHVVSSALSTFKTFANSSFPGWACPFVSAKAPKTSQKGVKLRKNQEICRCPWIWK